MPTEIGTPPAVIDEQNADLAAPTPKESYKTYVEDRSNIDVERRPNQAAQQYEKQQRAIEYYRNPTVKAKLFDRVAAFDPYVIENAPWMVQKLVTSNLDDSRVRAQARLYNSALPYINRVTGLGDNNGLLAPAMNYAVLTGNKLGVEFLRKVSLLNTYDQGVLLSYLYAGPDVAQTKYGTVGDIALTAQRIMSDVIPGAELGQLEQQGRAFPTVSFALPTGTSSVEDMSIALRNLFPGLSSTIRSNNSGFDQALMAMEPIDLRNPTSLYQAPVYNALKIAQEVIVKPTFMIGAAGLQATFNFSKWLALNIDRDPSDVPSIERKYEVLNRGLNNVFQAVDYTTDKAATGLLLAAGFNEENPNFAGASETISGITQLWAFGKVHEFGRGLKVGVESGGLGGEALLGIDRPFREVVADRTILGRLGVYNKVPFLSNAAFHFAEWSRYVTKKLAFDITSKPLEAKVYEYEPLQDFFDRVVAKRDEVGYIPGGDPKLRSELIARIEAMAGNRVPSSLIESLVDAPRKLMERAFVDYVKLPEVLGTDILEIKQNVARLKAEAQETSVETWDKDNAEAVKAAEKELSDTVDEVKRNLGEVDSTPIETLVDPDVPEPDGYLYHLGQDSKAPAIATQGLLPQFPDANMKIGGLDKPGQWEGGHAGGRNPLGKRTFFAETPAAAIELAQSGGGIGGGKLWLRVKRSAVETQQGIFEGERYTDKPISPADIEYYGTDGLWHSLDKMDLGVNKTLGEYIAEVGQNPAKMFADMPETALRMREGLRTYYDLAKRRNAAADAHAIKVLEYKAQEALAAKLAGIDVGVPVYKYPRIGGVSLGKFFGGFRSFSPRAAMLEPVTRLETALHTFFGYFARKGVDIAQTVNELPKNPVVIDPSSANKPLDWKEQNAHNVTYYLRTAGVPDAVARRTLGQLHDVTSKQGYFQWWKDFDQTMKDFLPKDMDPAARRALTNHFDRAMEERTGYDAPDGDPVLYHETMNPATGRIDKVPMPSDPLEFLSDSVSLGDVDMLVQSTAVINRFMSKFRQRRGLSVQVPKALRARLGMSNERVSVLDPAYYGTKAILATSTAIFKPLVLLLGLVRMASRISIEQIMRVHLFGGYKGILIGPGGQPITPEGSAAAQKRMAKDGEPVAAPDAVGPEFEKPTYADVGSLHDELTETPGQTGYLTEATGDYTRGSRIPKRAVFTGWAKQVEFIRNSRINMEMIKANFDVRTFMQWLTDNATDPAVSTWVRDQGGLLLDEKSNIRKELGPGATDSAIWQRFIERKMDTIRGILRDDPILIEAMKTGKIIPEGVLEKANTDFVTGESLTTKYNGILDNLDAANTRLAELRKQALEAKGDVAAEYWATYKALSEARRSLLIKEFELRTELGLKPGEIRSKDVVRISDTKALSLYLQDAWNQGRIELPHEVKVKKRLSYSDRTGPLEQMAHARSTASAFLYAPFKFLSWADLSLTRGSLWRQIADESYRNLRSRGYSKPDATAYAQLRAGELTRDIMYDLAARTSLHRKLKDLFWFAPATQEIAYTWLVKLPSTSYWPLGALSILGKGNALINIMQGIGLINKDETGAWVFSIPGMDKYVSKLSGFNFVASGKNIGGVVPIPGLSTLPSWWLSKEAKAHGGAFKTLSDWFVFQGLGEPQIIPQQINYLWEALTGNRSPLEFLSPDASKQQYDRSMDISIRFSFMELQEKGIMPPRPENFKTPLAYSEARDAYAEELMGGARDHFRAVAFHKLLGTTVAPAQMYENSPEATAFKRFYTKNIQPLFKPDSQGYTEQQRKLLDRYLAAHPNSLAYSISYYLPGEKTRDLAYESTPTTQYFDKLYTGELQTMEPEDYATFLAAMASQRYYLGQQNAALRAISPTLDPAEMMRNNYQRSQATLTYRENWNMYLSANPEAKAIVMDKQNFYVKKYGIEPETFEAQRYGELAAGVNSVARYFTGASGMRSEEIRVVLGQLKQLYAENSTFGVPTTTYAKGISAYMDKVVSPYYDAVNPIYAQINDATEAGLPTDKLYSQLDKIKAQYSDKSFLTINGEVYPSPEEFTFGSLKPAEREFAIANWATKPAYWLSEFQLGKVGYKDFTGRDELLTGLGNLEDTFFKTIQERDVTPASQEYDYYRNWTNRQEQKLASQYGLDGTKMLSLIRSVPAQRIAMLSPGMNQTFITLAGQAQQISDTLKANELSPRSYSKPAMYYKEWFLNQVQTAMLSDPEFAALMQKYSYALPEQDNMQKDGVPLVEALFFGQFTTAYIPADYLLKGEGL